jgi:hypothetical protein
LIDQLLGQYMAHVADLGYLLDEASVRKALKSIYRYNFKADLSEHEAVQRTYALNDDGGVLVASYPGGKRPVIPFPYFAEVWTGLEYQFAAHLIFEGMLAEGLKVVEAARRRHDGERRNPWNEPECGHHYARAMSSWALVVALNGFHYAGAERRLTFTPRMPGSTFRSHWVLPSGWGSLAQTLAAASQRVEFQAIEGSMALTSLVLNGVGKVPTRTASATLGKETVGAKVHLEGKRRVVTLDREVSIAPERALTVTLRL